MPFHKDRYDPAALLDQLAGGMPERDGTEWCLRFSCEDQRLGVSDFLAYLPEAQAGQQEAMAELRDFLPQLRRLDNDVQAACESDWRRSGLDATNFALHVAHLTPVGETMAVEYHGTVVNTSWTAHFRRGASGDWQMDNVSR